MRVAERRAVEATFLYHFTRFVEWPEDAFSAPDAPFRLCVVGEDPFGDTLDRAVRGESVGRHAIRVERHREPSVADGCHLLFLTGDEDPDAIDRVSGVREGRVLTVGETESFLRAGGLLRFVERGGRVALVVNDQARERSQLRLSSKLLQVAHVVRPERPGRGS